jgi:Protein of unknown function (DUF664)
MVQKVEGLDDALAFRSPVDSGTNLFWLVKHLTRAEIVWVLSRFAGLDVDIPDERPEPGESLASATDLYRATWQRVDSVAFSSDLDQLCRGPDIQPPVNLRWVLTHLLEETARHAGHADILRELIDGQTGR